MRKIKEVLRLHYECERTQREISQATGVGLGTIWSYLKRAKATGRSCAELMAMDEAALDTLLFPPAPPAGTLRPEPDWGSVHRELGKVGVTLELLWQEYRAAHPEGFGYSWFCEHYRAWVGTLSVTLRQTHVPGEKLFVDYSGKKIGIIDPNTGEIREAELFVATLGASNFTFAEATWTQRLPDWIGSHIRVFQYCGGVPEIVVPDNLKSGVNKPNFYDPVINLTYGEMAAHYGVAIIPARSRQPRDKAKVENAVLVVQRWILARLRNQRFFSLEDANRAIAGLLEALNDRAFKKLPGCRRSAFEEFDRPALKPLPAVPYQYAEWKGARVGADYHVEVDGHFCSVHYRHAREPVEVRFTQSTIEIFLRGQRLAAHARSFLKGRHTTIHAHMPPAHQAVTDGWDSDRLKAWAASFGPHTAAVVTHLLGRYRHPQQGYRASLGVVLGRARGVHRRLGRRGGVHHHGEAVRFRTLLAGARVDRARGDGVLAFA
jgi:transposase